MRDSFTRKWCHLLVEALSVCKAECMICSVFPSSVSFIHKMHSGGTKSTLWISFSYIFTVVKRGVQVKKKKIAHVDCQKSLLYCKKKKKKINCIHWWQVWVPLAGKGKGLCHVSAVQNPFSFCLTLSSFKPSKIMFYWLCWHPHNARIFLASQM